MQRLLSTGRELRTHGRGDIAVAELPGQLPRQRPVRRVLLTVTSGERHFGSSVGRMSAAQASELTEPTQGGLPSYIEAVVRQSVVAKPRRYPSVELQALSQCKQVRNPSNSQHGGRMRRDANRRSVANRLPVRDAAASLDATASAAQHGPRDGSTGTGVHPTGGDDV